MGTIDISYLSLLTGLLLLIIPVFYLWKFKTGLLKATLIGTARMIVQLFLIGMYLKYLFLWNNPWINFLWVIIMIFVAGQTALSRTGLKRKILLIPISVGFLCSVVLVGMYFIGIVLQLDNVFSAQYFIPIFGILMGNMLSSNVIALNTYYSGLKREEQLYCYLLGNGATRQEAQAPFIRQAIIKAFSPLIANIAVMGLVALPGTMIGQILGGSSPNVAIKYQMMIMVITFTASMLSLMITISLASRKSFDAYGKLLQVMVEKKEKPLPNPLRGRGLGRGFVFILMTQKMAICNPQYAKTSKISLLISLKYFPFNISDSFFLYRRLNLYICYRT